MSRNWTERFNLNKIPDMGVGGEVRPGLLSSNLRLVSDHCVRSIFQFLVLVFINTMIGHRTVIVHWYILADIAFRTLAFFCSQSFRSLIILGIAEFIYLEELPFVRANFSIFLVDILCNLLLTGKNLLNLSILRQFETAEQPTSL